MLTIKKLRADHVLDYAAEELKKYLRMMMPRCGEIAISYEPGATDGFRLGLLEDFGIESEAIDPVLDDVVHVDTDTQGGILAGSNSRSVLFAVYRFLRLNGCRWLYPGVDGDYVPMQDITPQKYHKMADHRFRGHCNEGAEYQQCMMETIEFYAKQELNVYMIEFDMPYAYYERYYTHRYNSQTRHPEKVTYEQTLQWKRQCEAEISKRGLMFHDMGHGWTADPYGLPSTEGWKQATDVELTPEQKEAVALMDGVRQLFKGVALNTNLCMSNPKIRSIMADAIVRYAESATNVDYLHVWLADGKRNHCECDECRKLPPSDYYLMIMNELDEKLTAKGLDTRIVFIAYVDTMFPPEQVTISNPQRFSLLYAPIHRSYCSSVRDDEVLPEPIKYERNNWELPDTAQKSLALLRQWQKTWTGPVFSYEYHYWHHQFRDINNLYIARRVYEDIRSLQGMGVNGYVEDGSQRSFWPNGFAIHVYAETLMDRQADFDKLAEDYFSHIYGEDWKQVYQLMETLEKVLPYEFVAGEATEDAKMGPRYSPKVAKQLDEIPALAAQLRAMVEDHRYMTVRPQAISWRLLELYCEYMEGYGSIYQQLALGNHDKATELAQTFYEAFGRHEFEIERYYDHHLCCNSLNRNVVKNPKPSLQEGI